MTTATDYAHSPRVEASRTLKAAALVQWLQANGRAVADVATMSEEQWKAAAKAAGTRPASRDTRRVVIDLMAHRPEERSRVCPTCGLGNPRGDHGPALPVLHAGECRR